MAGPPVVIIPGLSSKKSQARHAAPKLLRRPRAPRALPPLNPKEEEQGAGGSGGGSGGKEDAVQLFKDISFELDALQGVVAESDMPTDCPSQASPPPPSESDPHELVGGGASRLNVFPAFHSPASGATFVSKDDMKNKRLPKDPTYILDPLFRE